MATNLPTQPERIALAEVPAHRAQLAKTFLTTVGVGIVTVSGGLALVSGVAGSMPYEPPGLLGSVLWIGFCAAVTLGALAIGDDATTRAARAAKPLSVRRRHPATFATLILVGCLLGGTFKDARRDGSTFQRVVDTARPLGELEKRAAARPDDPLTQFALGVAYARAERFADADAPLRRAAALAPRAGIVHEWYAWTRLRLGDPNRAVAEYRLALANHDESFSAEEGLVRSLIGSRRAHEAERIAKQHLAADPHDARWLELLGWSQMMQTGRTADAIATLETASQYDHDSQWVEAMLAYAYRSQANFKVAIAHFERAFKLHPDPRIGYELGATHVLACNLASADSAFAATEKQFPKEVGDFPAFYRTMRGAAASRSSSASLACPALVDGGGASQPRER